MPNFKEKLYNALAHGSVLDLQKLFEQGCPVKFYENRSHIFEFALRQSPTKVDLLYAAGWHFVTVTMGGWISDLVLHGGSRAIDVYLDHVYCGPFDGFSGISMLDDLFRNVSSTDKSKENLLMYSVEKVLDLNAEIVRCKFHGLTALHVSIITQHFSAVKLLCERGTDPLEKCDFHINHTFPHRMTAREMLVFLFDLEENGDAKAVELYLRERERIDQQFCFTPKRTVKSLKRQTRTYLRKHFVHNVINVFRATSMLRNDIQPIPAVLIDYLEFK